MKLITLLLWWLAGLLTLSAQSTVSNTPAPDQTWQPLAPAFLVASVSSQAEIDLSDVPQARSTLLTHPDDLPARMTVALEAFTAKRYTEAASHYQRVLRHHGFERSACIAYLYALHLDGNSAGTQSLVNQLEDYFSSTRPKLRIQVDQAMRGGNQALAGQLHREERAMAFVDIVAQCLAADLLLQRGQATFVTLKLKKILQELDKIPLVERGPDNLEFARWAKHNLSVAEKTKPPEK